KPQDLLHQLPELRRARQISAISGEIDARQNDFGKARTHESPRLLDDGTHRYAARVSTSEGNDAERAAMIAAVLALQHSTGAALETVDELRRGLAHAHDVVDADAFVRSQAEVRVGCGQELLLIADNGIDLGHIGEAPRLDLRRTSCHDDARAWLVATCLPDG